jgi:hypothetical protein
MPMIMNLFLLVLSFVVVCNGANIGTKKAIQAQIILRADEIAKPGIPEGTRLYNATLSNNSTESIRVEVIQLPPEYGGGGTILYPCALQLWNSKSRRWNTLPPSKLSDHGPNAQVIHTEIKPAERLQVCRDMVSKEEIKGRRCGRFAFSFHWDHKPDVFSDIFSIPNPEHPDKTARCPD